MLICCDTYWSKEGVLEVRVLVSRKSTGRTVEGRSGIGGDHYICEGLRGVDRKYRHPKMESAKTGSSMQILASVDRLTRL